MDVVTFSENGTAATNATETGIEAGSRDRRTATFAEMSRALRSF